MPTNALAAPAADRSLDEIIASAVAVAEKQAASQKAPKNAPLFVRFVRQFYIGSPPDELNERTGATLCDAAARAWDLMQTRKIGAPNKPGMRPYKILV